MPTPSQKGHSHLPSLSTTGVPKNGVEIKQVLLTLRLRSGPLLLAPTSSALEGTDLDLWGQETAEGRTMQGAPKIGLASHTTGTRCPMPASS